MAVSDDGNTHGDQEITGRLDILIAEIQGLRAELATVITWARQYEPALQRAAALADSPVGRLAGKVSGRGHRAMYGS